MKLFCCFFCFDIRSWRRNFGELAYFVLCFFGRGGGGCLRYYQVYRPGWPNKQTDWPYPSRSKMASHTLAHHPRTYSKQTSQTSFERHCERQGPLFLRLSHVIGLKCLVIPHKTIFFFSIFSHLHSVRPNLATFESTTRFQKSFWWIVLFPARKK